MEGPLAIVTLFGGSAFVIWAFFQMVVRWREIGRETQVMTRLVDQLGGPGEVATFLESPAARRLFDRMIDRRTLVLQRVLRAIQSGIVLLVLGIALFIVRPQFTGEGSLGLLVFGTLSTALGIAFLLAAAVSYMLSRRWGLLADGS